MKQPKYRIGDYVVADGFTGWIVSIWINFNNEACYHKGPEILNNSEKSAFWYSIITTDVGRICQHQITEDRITLLTLKNMRVKYNGTSAT